MRITIFFLLSMSFSCFDLRDPIAPSWETRLNLPIKDTVYFLEDLIKPDDHIKVDSSNATLVYLFSSERYQRRFSVNEYIKGQIDGEYSKYQIPIVSGEIGIGIPFKNGAILDSAWIKAGNIEILLINNSATSSDIVTVVAVGILDSEGKPLTFSSNIEANSNKVINIDLAEYTYTSRFQENPNELYFEVLMENQTPTTDEIELQISILNSDFYYFDGELPEVNIKSISEFIELPITDDVRDYRNKIDFKDAKLEIRATYESDEYPLFSALFENFRLVGSTNENQVVELKKINGSNLDNQFVENGELFVEYNTERHNLSDFLSLVPDRVTLFSDVIMNPKESQNRRGIARNTDSILVEYFIEAKAEMNIDTVQITINEPFDLVENIKDIKYAKLNYQLKSEIPAQVDIDFYFKNENEKVIISKQKRLLSATVDSPDYSVMVVDMNDEIVFENNEIDILMNVATVEMIISFYTNQENFSAWFGPRLSINILTWAEIDYFIDNNKDN